MDEMVHSPTGLEEFIKLGRGSQPHQQQKSHKHSQHLGHWKLRVAIKMHKEERERK